MKTTKRQNKTYSKQLTKYQRERSAHLNFIFGMIAIAMLLALYSSAQLLITKHQEQAAKRSLHNIDIKDLTIITLTSSNPTNEQIAYLASFQAVDKYFSNYSEDKKLSIVYDLVSMARTENRNFSLSTPGNDSYDSLGLMQISKHYHPSITTEQQLDPYFNADWTLSRMISFGYPNNRDFSIQKHNGTPGITATLSYLQKVNNYKQYLINLNIK